MSNDSLVLSGANDIGSSSGWNGFVSHAYKEQYYSPDNQINNTTGYNEMDFYRIQDGKKKQPDYIIVFRQDGEIKFLDEAKKAQEQWGGLPIVVIDKDKCIESERQKVLEMKKHYDEGDKSYAKQLYQKVKNNRNTKHSFCSGIDIEMLKEEFEVKKEVEQETNSNSQIRDQDNNTDERQIGIKDLEENYDQTTPQERKNEMSKIRRINAKIQEIVNQKEGEEIG